MTMSRLERAIEWYFESIGVLVGVCAALSIPAILIGILLYWAIRSHCHA